MAALGSTTDRLAWAEAVASVAYVLIGNGVVWHALHAAAAAGRGDAIAAADRLRGDHVALDPAHSRRVNDLVSDLVQLARDPAGCADALLALESLDATVRAWRTRLERSTTVAAMAVVTPPDPTHPAGGRA